MCEWTECDDQNIRVLEVHEYVLTWVELYVLRNVGQFSIWVFTHECPSAIQESTKQPDCIENTEIDVGKDREYSNCLNQCWTHHDVPIRWLIWKLVS